MPIDVSALSTPSVSPARATLATPAVGILAALFAFGCVAPGDKGGAGADDGPRRADPDPGDAGDGPGGDGPGGDDTAPGDDTAADDTGDTDRDDTGSDPGDTDPGDTGPGDTDPGDPSAWSCSRWDDPVEVGTVADTALDEISDIVPSRANPGVLWVHEDSGGDPVLYALDTSGALLGTVTLTGVTNRDWEDMAVATCPDGDGDCLWVGDVGDNGLSRSDVALHVVHEPTVTAGFESTEEPTTYRYSFPDGRGNVEGFAVGADGLPVLVTKRVDATADVYRFPALDAARTVTVEHVARISTGDPSDEHPAEATSADISPDGSRLLVRTYGFLHEYPLTDGVPGAGVSLPAPDEPQGEAAAYDAARRGVWITSESARQPLWFVACAD